MNSNDKNTKRHVIAAPVKALMLLFVFFAIITQTGCGDKEVSRTDFCLNTTCTITVRGLGADEADSLVDEAFKNISEYEKMLSRTVSGSDIYNINASEGEPVKVSDETADVIEQGISMGDISGGKFDITVGRLTEMWNFTGTDPKVPPEEDIEAALPHIDYRNIEIGEDGVTLTDPEADIDLGGIAKGYIADRTGEFLIENGAESAIINLGGNVVAVGKKENGDPWNVGIERPYSDRTDIVGTVKAEDMTLVTSGIYERKFEENGVMYYHVLDPKTGYPAETDLESVTIKAAIGNSSFCDGLSTICLMLGKDKAIELIGQLQEKYPEKKLEAAFIDKDDNIVQTDGMDIQLSEE